MRETKFKYSVIGDNTQENREWLEKVGYVRQKDTPIDGDVLLTYVDDTDTWVYETASYLSDYVDTDRGSVINCIGNPPLFKAVSALREDSDYMQWFITDFSNKLIPTEPMYLCKVKCFNGVLIPYQFHEDGFHIGSGGFHKATLTELQERFKEKER